MISDEAVGQRRYEGRLGRRKSERMGERETGGDGEFERIGELVGIQFTVQRPLRHWPFNPGENGKNKFVSMKIFRRRERARPSSRLFSPPSHESRCLARQKGARRNEERMREREGWAAGRGMSLQ